MEDYSQLREKATRFRQIYERRRGQQEHLIEEKRQWQEKVEHLHAEIEDYTKARYLLQEAAAFAREQARQNIEAWVTGALQFVFSTDDIAFRVILSEKNNRPDAEFYVVSNYDGVLVETKPQDARGGGVVDIVSLALRIALMESGKQQTDGPLMLDEPGKHVSEEYGMMLAQFLKGVTQKTKRQVLLVTHNHYLAESGDRSYQVVLQQGISSVTERDRGQMY
ncbi:ATP-binding protein [Ammoniphilus sp. CFH 90114]|uniref:ATP-binding protein n=1 Tax=Ammoniphilus sp. CFH 90114 TaxID=2493665 RepID=UPI00100ED18C|nr:ATP-binding protein [Ammoniphilus sp. CFH 90114]RXT08094.1 ATP-binding protein [Ammoniphilus sp. CFH 90114]